MFANRPFRDLAAGLGVVSAPIPELRSYADVVRIAADATQFVQQTQAMLMQARDAEFRSRCVAIAREKTWDARVRAASELVYAKLAQKVGVGDSNGVLERRNR